MKKLKYVNNPELVTTGTDDLSSGASNRSKTTMCTDVAANSAASLSGVINGGEKISINIDYDSQKEAKDTKKRRR